jgi:DNA-binding response OmpR family regulator
MQLLVVEDDDHVASALVSVLSRHGFETVRARDGQGALDALNPGTDMVLLDLTLPDMDGFEVCERIRRVSDAPVIMVTARSQLDARVRGLEMGADDYLVKPYDLRELLARIEAVFRRGRSHEWMIGRTPRRFRSGTCASTLPPASCGWTTARSCH